MKMLSPKMAFKMEVTGTIGELCIYDDVTPDRRTWNGEVIESDTDANRIREKLENMGNISELKVYVSSNGGDVQTGLAIYSQLKRLTCKKIAYIDGFAFSIASVIPMACDEVIMYPTSVLMVHNASAGCFGNAEFHRKFADDLDVISASAVTAYLDKAGDKLDRDTLNNLLNAETYLSAEDCLKYGLCDRIESNTFDKQSNANPAMCRYLAAQEGIHGDAVADWVSKKAEELFPQPKKSVEADNISDKTDMLVSAFINSIFK